MQYSEYAPSPQLSQHIECFWEMKLQAGELDRPMEFLSPDCTYNLMIADKAVEFKSQMTKTHMRIGPGAIFLGQYTHGLNVSLDKAGNLFGIRFKPFALANVVKMPLFHLNNLAVEPKDVFSMRPEARACLDMICETLEIEERKTLAEKLVLSLLDSSLSVDQKIRAQTNFILDRKGIVKISQVFESFGVSKVTLRKHFLEKVGLSPKQVSRIWRLNYFLQLQKQSPKENLTNLCLDAGYYDQAHFIKEFKAYFGRSPRQFFQYKSQLITISQKGIYKRFTHQYDPRT